MKDIVLYDKPECPFCWRIRMALHALKLPYRRVAYDDPAHEPVWRELTPNATVPVLRIDSLILVDSWVMLEYLHERNGGLWPETPAMRAKARTIARYADDRVGAAVREVIFERRDRAESLWNKRRIGAAMDAWRASLPFLSAQLGGGEYFAGACSAADHALASRFGLALAYQMSLDEQYPNLASWLQRMSHRAEFVETAPPVVSRWLSLVGSHGQAPAAVGAAT